MTVDEKVRAARACLAEAGYPNAVVYWHPDRGLAIVASDDRHPETAIPVETVWRTLALVQPEATYCWPCFNANEPGCPHDLHDQPWPQAVPA